MKAPLPPNEGERLAVLASYEVLDTPREPAFDDLVHLASFICQTPIAAITLIDRDRQWFKASEGISKAETSRELSFCAHAILRPHETIVVEDARLDPRFADHPGVMGEPGVRFYAAAPVISVEGFAVGTLCVAGLEVRALSANQREALAALSRQVAAQLELRRTLASMRRQSKALERARDMAEAANRAKSAFLAKMGHEIRTPMNGIVGLAEVLAGTSLSPRQRRYVENISSSGHCLMGVLASVLDGEESELETSEGRLASLGTLGAIEDLVHESEPVVLVAEDNEVNSLVLSAMLEEHGCQVVCVENGSAAVDALQRTRFDLVFMDIQMPVMDGIEATQAFRLCETEHRIPIVAVTASAICGDHARYREAGMDDMIEKPISERAVVDALRRWLPQVLRS